MGACASHKTRAIQMIRELNEAGARVRAAGVGAVAAGAFHREAHACLSSTRSPTSTPTVAAPTTVKTTMSSVADRAALFGAISSGDAKLKV